VTAVNMLRMGAPAGSVYSLIRVCQPSGHNPGHSAHFGSSITIVPRGVIPWRRLP
jgi:hypothetical protein